MLHNSGPYGPNDVPVNMGMPVNISQMSNPMNLGNNLANLGKMPQQAPQTVTSAYNMPDYPSFGHPPLNMGHPMSPFANYHPLNFPANYGQPTFNLQHDTNSAGIQNNMLPMNLNIQSDNGPNLMNYQSIESKKLDISNAQLRENFNRKLPINIPQIHTKAFHKQLEMNTSYSQSNYIQENIHSNDLSKNSDKSLIDSSRRKSLENTVKLIENILINSTSKDRVKNSDNTESFNTSDHIRNILHDSEEDNITKQTNVHLSQDLVSSNNPSGNVTATDLRRTNSEIENTNSDIQDFCTNRSNTITNQAVDLKMGSQDRLTPSDKSIPPNNEITAPIESTKIVEMEQDTATSTIQSEIHCERLRPSLINNHTKSKEQNRKETDEVKKIAEVDIKKELEDDTVNVKVEPLTSDEVPFLKDSSAVQRDILETDVVIVKENNVAEAQEAMKKGSDPKTYYECCHCKLIFKHPKRFLIHTKWHSFGQINEKLHELARERELRKTMKKEAKIMERLNSKEVKEGVVKVHPCKDCDRVFPGKSSLKNHRQKSHPTRVRECKICKISVVGWMQLRAHMTAHTGGGGYQCSECPKRFKYAHSLAKHKDTHLEKTHGCEQCEKKFGSLALLKMHMKCHERTARGTTFRCTYCGKGFYESYNLQVHERTHRNERPFQCDICKTSFGTNSSLKRHIKVSHSTLKPFPCPTCHRCFASTTTRARHVARVHADPSTRPHACARCPRRYKGLKELHRHVSKAHPEAAD